MKLSFRPHHFLCTLGFLGMGYSPKFIENYNQIVGALQDDEESPIQVVEAKDSICNACPHQGEEGCQVEEKVHKLDTRHQHILNINVGDVLSWREAKRLLKEKMTLEAFHQACTGCEWKPLGVCENALKKLHTEAA